MVEFSQRFPQQYFDVAIAEQHAVTFAAGLAIGGYKPVVAIYSTFLQRAYDQLIHDVAIQDLPVLFAIDRAGIVGADGQTHQGAFDISFMRCIPNLIIMTPSNENECRQMLYTGYHCGKPAAVRYPRGNAVGVTLEPLQPLELGKSKRVREGKKIAILNFGTLLPNALVAAEKLDATVIDMRFVKPLDVTCINEIANSHELLVTLEENAIQGGAGSAVAEVLNQQQHQVKLLQLGLPDFFIPQGSQAETLTDLKLDAAGIEQQIVVMRGTTQQTKKKRTGSFPFCGVFFSFWSLLKKVKKFSLFVELFFRCSVLTNASALQMQSSFNVFLYLRPPRYSEIG